MIARLKLFIPLIVFVLLAAVLYSVLKTEGYDPKALPSALINQKLPAFDLPTLVPEKRITDKQLLGEVYLLNVWATWCISCRVEHKYLNQLAEQGVKIIGLNYKDESDKAITWLKKLGNPYSENIADTSGKLGLDLGVYGAPETYLIDKQGMIRFKFVGIVDDKVWQEKFKTMYQSLL